MTNVKLKLVQSSTLCQNFNLLIQKQLIKSFNTYLNPVVHHSILRFNKTNRSAIIGQNIQVNFTVFFVLKQIVSSPTLAANNTKLRLSVKTLCLQT